MVIQRMLQNGFRNRTRDAITGNVWNRIWSKMQKRRYSGDQSLFYRGSFTIEAVFLFPAIVLLIAFMLHLSMDWYESIRQAASDVDVLRQLDTRTCFLNQSMLREILDVLN